MKKLISKIILLLLVLQSIPFLEYSEASTIETQIWRLDNSSNYILSNNTELEVSDGVGKLKYFTGILYNGDNGFGNLGSATYDIIDDATSPGIDNIKVYSSLSGRLDYHLPELYPVDTNNSYSISWDYKSTGPVLSRSLYGLNPYNLNQSRILSQETLRVGDEAIVSSLSSTGITTNGVADLSTWSNAGGHWQSIGFYYDGDTSKLPDYLLFNGAYSSASGSTILLSKIIPDNILDNIILGTTVVSNHHGGGTYIYTGTVGAPAVSTSWNSYTGSLTGESFNGGVNQFRPETKYVSVIAFLNFGRGEDSSMSFDNILFVPDNGGEYSIHEPTIETATGYSFDTKLLSFTETLGTNNVGTVGYQVSTDDGTTWNYYNGSSWEVVPTRDNSHASARTSFLHSTAAEIHDNIDTLDTDGGSFKWKAFLESDGQQQVEIDSIEVTKEVAEPFDTGFCSTTNIPESECLALKDLYVGTTGSGWTNNSNWGLDTDVDSWNGIVLDAENDNVQRIVLVNNNLNGSLDSSIGNFTELSYIALNTNYNITGNIPSEIGNLTKLTYLNLGLNKFSGTIPTEIGLLVNLDELYLHYNDLSGEIPVEIGNMTNLRGLYAFSNDFSGTIPSELGNLSNLEYLGFRDNQLSGTIPLELGNLSNLENLQFHGNNLSGEIPEEIWGLSNLQYLHLDNNDLVGRLPDKIMDLTQLFNFTIKYNSLDRDEDHYATISPELKIFFDAINIYNINFQGDIESPILSNPGTITSPQTGTGFTFNFDISENSYALNTSGNGMTVSFSGTSTVCDQLVSSTTTTNSGSTSVDITLPLGVEAESVACELTVTDFGGNTGNLLMPSFDMDTLGTDSDEDGIPDYIEEQIGTDPTKNDTDGDGESDENNDLDGVSPLIEIGAPNAGDGNGDGELDAVQEHVTSIPNAKTGKYNIIEVSKNTSCTRVGYFANIGEENLNRLDNDYDYEHGLWDMKFVCINPGDTAEIKIFLDKEYDSSGWLYRKYDRLSDTYTDISNHVTYTSQTVGSGSVTVINYSIVDGGPLDEDGLVNAEILDPSGPSFLLPATISSSSSGGGGWGGGASNRGKGEQNDEEGEDVSKVLEETSETRNIKNSDEKNQTEVESIDKEEAKKGDKAGTCSVMASLISDVSSDTEYAYVDLDGHNYEESVKKFVDVEIVKGRNLFELELDSEITRSEFLAIALKSHCIGIGETEKDLEQFKDSLDFEDWQKRVISSGLLLGIISGDKDGSGSKIFRPNDIISVYEMNLILKNIQKYRGIDYVGELFQLKGLNRGEILHGLHTILRGY